MATKGIAQLGLTASQWGLYDDGRTGNAALGIAEKALNQALREAATAVEDEIRAAGPLRGRKLDAAIERAIYDKWEDVAASYKRLGAADTAVRDEAFLALQRFFRGRRLGEARAARMEDLFARIQEALDEAVELTFDDAVEELAELAREQGGALTRADIGRELMDIGKNSAAWMRRVIEALKKLGVRIAG